MVELDITHNFIAGEGTLVDDGDWNDTHNISGGGTLRVPQLIEEKTIPAGTTSVTFSNLNGDVDGEYLLTVELTSIDGKAQSIYPNNDTTLANYDGVNYYAWSGGAGTINKGDTKFSGYESQANDSFVGHLRIWAKTGKYRTFIMDGTAIGSATNTPVKKMDNWQWKNNSSNITSLVIVHEDADHGFSGVINLYKMVDLVL